MKLMINKTEIAYFFISLIVLLISITGIFPGSKVYMYLLVGIFIFLFFLTVKRKNYSLYQIYLVSYFVFLVSHIFMDCIGLYDAHTLALYQSSTMSDVVLQESVRTITSFLIGTSYAWLFQNEEENTIYFEKTNIESNRFIEIIQKLYYVFIVLYFLKTIYLIIISRSYGYSALFDGTLEQIAVPAVFRGVGTITEALSIIVFYYKRDEKSFRRNMVLFMTVLIIGMLTGRRGTALSFLLFFMYMWSTYYHEIKIKNFKVLGLAIIIPVLIEVIANFRYQKEIGLLSLLGGNALLTVFETQGSTLNVVADTIILSDKFTNKVPFFIGYFTDLFKVEPPGQVMEDILYGDYLGDHLMYNLNSRLFFLGRGTGTSIVAEAYDLVTGNQLLIFLFAIVTTVIVFKVCNKAYKSLTRFSVAFLLASDFILSPRGSILSSLNIALLLMLFTLGVQLFQVRRTLNQ